MSEWPDVEDGGRYGSWSDIEGDQILRLGDSSQTHLAKYFAKAEFHKEVHALVFEDFQKLDWSSAK